jgi:hypothetical protein
LQLHNLHEFNRIVERLISKFDPPAGELGTQLRLNSRKQLINESLTDYFDALLLLARKTNLNEEAQHTKIIETVFTGAQDPAVRKKIIKFIAHAQDQQLTNQEKWFHFNALIKQITKLNALEAYTTTSQLFKDSETVAVLNNKLDNLIKCQQKLGNCSINAEKESLPRQNYQNEPRSQLSGYRNASGYSPRNNYSQYHNSQFSNQSHSNNNHLSSNNMNYQKHYYDSRQPWSNNRNFTNSNYQNSRPVFYPHHSFYAGNRFSRQHLQPRQYQPQYSSFNKQYDRPPQQNNYRNSYYSNSNRFAKNEPHGILRGNHSV